MDEYAIIIKSNENSFEQIPKTYENYKPTGFSDLLTSGMNLFSIIIVFFQNLWLLFPWNW
jgi:hypothetical protein